MFKDRFADFLKANGHSVQSLADRIGVTRTALVHLQSGRNLPSFDLLAKLVTAFPDLDLKWFLTGEVSEGKTLSDSNAQSLQEHKFDRRPPQPPVSSVPNQGNRIILLGSDGTYQEFIPS